MAFSTTKGNGRRGGRIARATMAEINVTPLVDVMLVLLVIFMIASSMETARLSREAETLRQVGADAEVGETSEQEQQVPVDLPKAKADKLIKGKGKEAKPVLTFDRRRRIFLGVDLLVDCRSVSGPFERCLDRFEAALQRHPQAEQARDVHLRADERLRYGYVLALMARMRRAGIRHFGLITQGPAGKAAP